MKHLSLLGFPVVLMFLFIGCASNESCVETGTCPDVFVERTDIQISGQLDLWDNQVVYEVDNVRGPISLGFYEESSSMFDFEIELESGYSLVIRLVNNTVPEPWTHVGTGYNAYPGQELDDKIRYVSAELRSGSDAPAFSTNQSGLFPASVVSSAFWIVSSDEHQIKGRIKDLVLYHSINTSQRVYVNGTFIARFTDDGKDL